MHTKKTVLNKSKTKNTPGNAQKKRAKEMSADQEEKTTQHY